MAVCHQQPCPSMPTAGRAAAQHARTTATAHYNCVAPSPGERGLQATPPQHKHTPLTARMLGGAGRRLCDAAVLSSREQQHRRGTLLPAHLYRATANCLADVDQALVYMRVASTRYSLPTVLPSRVAATASVWVPRAADLSTTAKPQHSKACCRMHALAAAVMRHAQPVTTLMYSVHRHTLGPAAVQQRSRLSPPLPLPPRRPQQPHSWTTASAPNGLGLLAGAQRTRACHAGIKLFSSNT